MDDEIKTSSNITFVEKENNTSLSKGISGAEAFAVDIKNVSKRYYPLIDKIRTKIFKKEARNSILAVDNVSLQLKKGEIFGLLGANGAGKTTLIKMLCGLIKANSGTISIYGNDISVDTEKALENIGAIVEAPTLYPDFTGKQNLRYFANIQGGLSDKRIDDIVELVGLKDRINSKFSTYSLGMQQRLGIAQAIMHNPKVLILDEPINGLDPDGILQVRQLLKNIAENYGTTILISSHILSEIQNTCDRVGFMVKGKLAAVKAIDELEDFGSECIVCVVTSDNQKAADIILETFSDTQCKIVDSKLYVKTKQENTSLLNKTLVLANIEVSSVAIKHKTLEDYYKELMKNEK